METQNSLQFFLSCTSSYPTYEEWKHNFSCFHFLSPVRSYPTYEEWKHEFMNCATSSFVFPFLSYLWGMETLGYSALWAEHLYRSYPTYEEWKPVLEIWFIPAWNEFLSYLWGMETKMWVRRSLSRLTSSYPTYEEWKQTSKQSLLPYLSSSYPTYEEWKPGMWGV